MQIDLVTGDNRRPKSAGEIRQIEHCHTLQPRDLGERVIVGEQTRFQYLGDPHQTGVRSKIDIFTGAVMNRQFHFARTLQLIQNFQTAPAALAPSSASSGLWAWFRRWRSIAADLRGAVAIKQ